MEFLDLYKNGIEEAKISGVIVENLLIISMIALGFMNMLQVEINGIPIVSLCYLFFVAVMLIFVLRKQLCTMCCYYGKQCHCGWGKLSAALFKQGSGNRDIGGKLAGLTWAITMILPIIVSVALLIMGKTLIKEEIKFLGPFIILVFINGVLHKKSCENCKMRYICPGSAARTREKTL